MERPKVAIVLTTINDPDVLEHYHRNIAHYGHLDHTQLIIIPDRKTPSQLWERCEALREKGMNVLCPTLSEQEDFLARIGRIARLIPYNSDNRRNVGFLLALESGIDVMISIDDDNYPRDEDDFVTGHSAAMSSPRKWTMIRAEDHWFNVCSMLVTEPEDYPVYARGFPYRHRHQSVELQESEGQGRVSINLGLWLGEPDVDAMTRLCAPVTVREYDGQSHVLDRGTWTPINTQNTGLHRDVLPSYYFVRMGANISGMKIDRYGDIFSGYFAQACAHHLGHHVRVGGPITDHIRNPHDHLLDLTREVGAIVVLEDLLEWLVEAQLEGSTYGEAYVALSHGLEDAVEGFGGSFWTMDTRAYFHSMAHHMRVWVESCRLLGVE